MRGRTDYVLRGVPDPLSTLRFDVRPAWQFLIAEDRRRPGGGGDRDAAIAQT